MLKSEIQLEIYKNFKRLDSTMKHFDVGKLSSDRRGVGGCVVAGH